MRFQPIRIGEPVVLDGRSITALPANHTVPAVGYALDSGTASLVFSVAASGRPAPAITCLLGSAPITSPYTFPVGASAVTCTASNAAGMAACNFTVTVLDREAPVVACSPVSNPGGKNGGNQSGSNANEFFQLLSQDNCDPNPQIFVHDSASALVAGPFANGDIVQITQNTSAATVQRQTGGAVVAHIILKGTALLVASDAQGNASTPQAGCPAR